MLRFLKALIIPATGSQHPLYDLTNKAREESYKKTRDATLLYDEARQKTMEAEQREDSARLAAKEKGILAQWPKERLRKKLEEAALRGEFYTEIPVDTNQPVYFSDRLKPSWKWPIGSKDKMMTSIIDNLQKEPVSPEVDWSYSCPQFDTYKKCVTKSGKSRPAEECTKGQCILRASWGKTPSK